jgi:hypothetical protein
MTNQHPITPPPELVEKWEEQFLQRPTINGCFIQSYIAAKAAQWGSDQELEACCQELPGLANFLRATRRPKPPSLKEQALALVEQHKEGWRPSPKDWDTIRRALEAQ